MRQLEARALQELDYCQRREVTIVTDAPSAITVAYGHHPKLKNQDLILRLRAELSRLKPSFQHVYGHAGHKENALVDRLASDAARGQIRSPPVKP